MRKPYFDNLKFMLIFCVVVVHFIECFRVEAASFRGMYLFLGYFTMPAFAWVSGYFSKSFSPRLKDISMLLIPYLAFQGIYIAFFQWLALDKTYWSSGWNFTVPFMQSWYLLSLLCWRLMSLYARQIKHSIALSFVLALLAGFEHRIGWEFSFARTIGFFPFFLLGMHMNETVIERFRRFRSLGWILLLGLMVFSMALSFFAPAKADVFIWNLLYATPYGSPREVIYRMVSYGFSLVAMFAILAIIPHRETGYTRFGARTLSVYLLHIFFALGFEKVYTVYTPIQSELIVIGCAIAVAVLLSLKPVYKGLMFPFMQLNRWLELRSVEQKVRL